MQVVSPMKFFELSLRHRLLLAIVPSTILLLPVNFEDVAAYGHAALYGGLVMAPFITPGHRLVLRFGLIVATPMLVTFALIQATSEGVVPQFLLIQPVIHVDVTGKVYGIADQVFDLLEMALLLALLPAFILFIVAPLRVSWKYWIYAFSSGILTAASVFVWVQWFWCIWGCTAWDNVLKIIPFTIWALSFCIAVHFGRARGHAGGSG